MEDMTSKIQTISEKLEQEAKLRHVAYEVGDFYLQAQALGNERFVTLFDKNFSEITKESYDSSLTPTETINEFCDKYDFEAVETIMNRTATMLDSENFYYNFLEMRDKDTVSTRNEQELQDPTTPQFAIFRLKDTEHTQPLKEEALETLIQLGMTPDKSNYECLYVNQLEELMPNCFEVMDERPDVFRDEFEEAIYNALDYDGEFTENHYGLFDSDVIALQNEGEITFFYNNENGLLEIDFQNHEAKVAERTAQIQETTEQTVKTETNDSMKLDIYQKSDKLSIESGATAIAYQAGDFFVAVNTDVGGSDVMLYDSNLDSVRHFPFADMDNITEVINLFCEQIQFDGSDSLRNRSAELLNYGAFMENYAKAEERRDQSIELEQQWIENPKDSFTVYALNDTEHNEQLIGRGMAFLEKVGEDLDKRNFHCIFTDDLDTLQVNDPLFYGETDMEQHFLEALQELKDGVGDKLLTMIEVKSPQMKDLSDDLQTGCVLGLKIDGEVKQYFIEDTGLKEVDFQYLTPNYVDKFVEQEKSQFYDDLLENSWTISDFVTQPLTTFDKSCIAVLVESAVEMNPESTRKDIYSFLGDAINEGDILPKDFRNIEVRDFVGAVVDLDKSQLLEFSTVPKEEQSNGTISYADMKEQAQSQQKGEVQQEKTDLSSLTTEQLMDRLQEDSTLRHVVTETAELSKIQGYFTEELSVTDLKTINHMASMVGTQVDEHEKTADDILLFISNAVNEGEISPSDLRDMAVSDFVDVFRGENSLASLVAEEIPPALPDITPVQGEENTFQFTLTTQERVVIQAATDHEFDHNYEHDEDYRWVLRDILDEIDPNGDLLSFYPDDYTFEINDELLEKITLTFSEEELEVIAESCHEASVGWENIPESYREVLDSIVDKIENKDKILLDMTMETQAVPENEPRIAAHSYEITDSVVMGGEEIAIGVAPSGVAGTWERNVIADEEKGLVDNWYSGHYFDTQDEAMEDFQQRIEDKLEERQFVHGDKSVYSEKNPENGDKAKDKLKEGENTPRESVMAKLKEIKSQIAKTENKELPTKTKPDQTI